VVAIREAQLEDIPAITGIQNELHDTTAIAWTDERQTVDGRTTWFHQKAADGVPVLVADDDGTVVGFTTYGDFRDTKRWPGYRVTCELTIFVTESRWGTGVGRQLIEALCRRAAAAGKHTIVAAIDAENDASLRFHEKLGFVEVGRMPEIGTRFGRWLSLVIVQKHLTDGPPPPVTSAH
jgi:L-amino acid N-acyltransferase YncA